MSNPSTENCGITIKVSTQYLQQQSDPARQSYAFAYTITIVNERDDPVRLVDRHWVITDQNNKIEKVDGKGVVGQQPVIQPGKSFQYSSGAIIQTEIGDMHGSYTMEAGNGDLFEAPIPLFVLATPAMIH